jgi:hypothetical protein
MWPVGVVVLDVVDDEAFELMLVPDDGAVEELAAEGSDPAFSKGVRYRGPNRCFEDPQAFGCEDLVEGVDELACGPETRSWPGYLRFRGRATGGARPSTGQRNRPITSEEEGVADAEEPSSTPRLLSSLSLIQGSSTGRSDQMMCGLMSAGSCALVIGTPVSQKAKP